MWFIWLVTKFWNAAVVAAFFFLFICGMGLTAKSAKVYAKDAKFYLVKFSTQYYPLEERRTPQETQQLEILFVITCVVFCSSR
jgi:hypothetical protein